MFGVSENKNTFPTIGLKNITNGGYLCIGVSDDKKALALEPDFSLSQGNDSHDFFNLIFN